MTPQTPFHRLMAASALMLVLLAGTPALAQATASAPASAPATASTRNAAPEPASPTPTTAPAAQDLRYGAGYRARQAFVPNAVDRAPQAPAHRRGRGR
jgi:hypothetical protein